MNPPQPPQKNDTREVTDDDTCNPTLNYFYI